LGAAFGDFGLFLIKISPRKEAGSTFMEYLKQMEH
jgi:hypothetical protein